MEKWRDIKGYEGLYMASNLGRVKSLDRILTFKDGRKRISYGRILSAGIDQKGYLRIVLCNANKRSTQKVHRIVASSFIENKESKSQVNHIDGNKKNNKLENLEWNTNKENSNHYCKNKHKFKKEERYKPSAFGKMKIPENLILMLGKISDKEISRRTGISLSTVGRRRRELNIKSFAVKINE